MHSNAEKQNVLVVDAQVASLEEIGDFIQQKADESGLSFKRTWELMLAVDEVCSNMIAHAGPDDVECRVETRWKNEPDCVTISISDNAFTFNPLTVAADEEEVSEESKNLGGMGTYLIGKMVDTAEYRREDGMNTVTIRKFKKRNANHRPREQQKG